MKLAVLTFSEETIHHPAYELDLVLEAEVDEIGINKNTIWGYECVVVLQEKGGCDLCTFRRGQLGMKLVTFRMFKRTHGVLLSPSLLPLSSAF